jgi:hypothetical protein
MNPTTPSTSSTESANVMAEYKEEYSFATMGLEKIPDEIVMMVKTLRSGLMDSGTTSHIICE